MKTKHIYTYLLMAAVALLSVSCQNDNPATPRLTDLAYEKLAGEWTLGQFGSIKADGADVSANYPGFALSFGEGSYSTTNAGDLFRASGTWEWADEDGTMVSLDDGKLITIEQLNPNRFVFSFTKSDGPVRAGLAGNYTITVLK